jgi:hypothetical protein
MNIELSYENHTVLLSTVLGGFSITKSHRALVLHNASFGRLLGARKQPWSAQALLLWWTVRVWLALLRQTNSRPKPAACSQQ